MDASLIAIIALMLGGVWLMTRQDSSGLSGVALWASNAGFSGPDLTTAVAICYAESGGNPNAYNPETQAGAPEGKGSYGLWQIYLFKHPEFEGQNLYDPQTNANAAFSIYTASGQDFSAWTTFDSGKYTAYLTQATQEVSA